MSIGLTVKTPFVRSTWYTKVALPEVALTSTVAAFSPPGIVMVNALPANPLATKPSGSVEGVRIVAAADQPFAPAGSFQIEKLTPREGTAPTVPPKLTLSLVAAMNSLTAFVPLVTTGG